MKRPSAGQDSTRRRLLDGSHLRAADSVKRAALAAKVIRDES